MLLLIDAAKIKQKLLDARPSYVVSSCNIEAVPIEAVQSFDVSVTSTGGRTIPRPPTRAGSTSGVTSETCGQGRSAVVERSP